MIQVDERLEQTLEAEGYVRMKDSDTGAWFVRGADAVHFSGYLVIVRSYGFTKSFPIEKARQLGIQMMEKITRMRPRPCDGKEETHSYDFPQRNRQF